MKRGERLAALLFRVVCLSFSALLLVLTLFCHIRLVRAENEIADLNKAVADAGNERILLEIRRDRSLRLDELERRAVQELGMRHPEPGQITAITYLG